jgi:hypothetical protein
MSQKIDDYKIMLTDYVALDYTQTPMYLKAVTLMKGDEIIFENLKKFQAHKKLWDMGLKHLINWK